MPRPVASRQLGVWMNGERVGTWTLRRGTHMFRYDDQWLASPTARPLSLSMPLQASAAYTGAVVEAFFDNLLPESPSIRQRVRARFATASDQAFDLLAEVGRDCIGAVQLVPHDQSPDPVDTIQSNPLAEADVAARLRGTVGSRLGDPVGFDDFRISIAGAQEKTALLWHGGQWHLPLGSTPTTHILKLPMGLVGGMRADFSSSVENEWLCAQIARAYGLPVADCSIATFEDQKALVVTRFDRRLASAGTYWLRLPQEDFCQATGTPAALKYEADGGPGVERGMDLLLGSANALEDREIFFRSQLVFWLLCATDGHAKNFSLHIEAEGRYRLAPLYDILSAYPILGRGAGQLAPERARMAMAVRSTNRHYEWARILPRHWDATARRCGFPAERASAIRTELAAMTAQVVADVSSRLAPTFPDRVAGPIFEGMRTAAERLGGAAD